MLQTALKNATATGSATDIAGITKPYLDAVKGNLAAAKLYEKAGFANAGDHKAWYEDTGDIVVELFEYVY